jgi:hypothetical protein
MRFEVGVAISEIVPRAFVDDASADRQSLFDEIDVDGDDADFLVGWDVVE